MDNKTGIAFGNVRTRIGTDYTDLHELVLPHFLFVDKGISGNAFGKVRTRIDTDCTDLHGLHFPIPNSWPFVKIRG